jgi:hypothetical protein
VAHGIGFFGAWHCTKIFGFFFLVADFCGSPLILLFCMITESFCNAPRWIDNKVSCHLLLHHAFVFLNLNFGFFVFIKSWNWSLLLWLSSFYFFPS